MKTILFFLLFLNVFVVAFFSTGCDTTPNSASGEIKRDTATANTKVAEAYVELENQFFAASQNPLKTSSDFDLLDFSKAEKLYMDAVAADPENPAANFGAGFTRMLTVYADSIVKNAVKRWESPDALPLLQFGIPTSTKDMKVPTEIVGRNVVKIIQTAVSDPPTIGEMQAILRDRVLPRLTYALERFAVVETKPTFELKISGKMQGDAARKPVYLDLTEVYVMDALLQGMKAMVEQFLVFRFDLSGYNTKAFVEAIRQDNMTFFVRASDGATRAQNVKTSLVAMIGRLRSGINFLKGETDNQDDDIIKKGSSGVSQSDLDTTLSYLSKIETALTGTYSIDVKNADSDGNDYTIQVSLGSFYNNVPQYPKQAWFPPYTVDTTAHGDIQWHWTQQDYGSFTFPDPTFSGLFPNMTNEKLKRLLYVDEAFAWRVHASLWDDNGMLGSSDSLKLVISGKTYYSKAGRRYGSISPYGRFLMFYVLDNANQPVQQVIAVLNGQDLVLTMSKQMIVQHKSSDYLTADVTAASQSITAQVLTSPLRVELDLRQYAFYKFERSIGTGAFSVTDSSNSRYYYDYNVSPVTSYRYRALRLRSPYTYYYGYVAVRPNNYTNTVSVTTP